MLILFEGENKGAEAKMEIMEIIDIVAFARDNGAFSNYSPGGMQYIADNAQTGAEITNHELLFEDMYGYIRTWSFRVENGTGKIVPYDDGFRFRISGFNPDEMRKKLAMVDKAKAALESRTAEKEKIS